MLEKNKSSIPAIIAILNLCFLALCFLTVSFIILWNIKADLAGLKNTVADTPAAGAPQTITTEPLDTALILDRKLLPAENAVLRLEKPGLKPVAVPMPKDMDLDLYAPGEGILVLSSGTGWTLRVLQTEDAPNDARSAFFRYSGSSVDLRSVKTDNSVIVLLAEAAEDLPDNIDNVLDGVAASLCLAGENSAEIDGIGINMNSAKITLLQSGILSLKTENDAAIDVSPMTVRPSDNLEPMDTGSAILYGTGFLHEESGLMCWVLHGLSGDFMVAARSGQNLKNIFADELGSYAPPVAPETN